MPCVRLAKLCDYSDPSSSRAVDLTGLPPLFEGPDLPFPTSFFLDTSFFTPFNSSTDLAQGPTARLRQIISDYLAIPDREVLHDDYFSTIHQWFPMISEKRLLDVEFALQDGCHDLLLLCMRLCTISSNNSTPSQNPLYSLAKSLSSAAENTGLASLRLIQSLVLLAVYEVSHAIYPAAYLTIGRAARLGLFMGWHDRDAQQLFKPADTWSLREEQRRTWWSIFILDRLVTS
ncbi:hypothetical protein ACHAPT_013407 [Fusarium lateritium]